MLQLQMAIRGGVRVGDGELNQAFEEIAKNNEMTLEAFIESLESEGASYEELRDQVRKEMIIQRVQRGKVGRQVDITEQELDGFLATEGSVKELSPELFIRQILVEDKIKALIAEQLGVKPEEVTPEASFIDDLGADSLDTVELIMALEEEFSVEIPDEDAEKMTTVGDAIKYVNEKSGS